MCQTYGESTLHRTLSQSYKCEISKRKENCKQITSFVIQSKQWPLENYFPYKKYAEVAKNFTTSSYEKYMLKSRTHIVDFMNQPAICTLDFDFCVGIFGAGMKIQAFDHLCMSYSGYRNMQPWINLYSAFTWTITLASTIAYLSIDLTTVRIILKFRKILLQKTCKII